MIIINFSYIIAGPTFIMEKELTQNLIFIPENDGVFQKKESDKINQRNWLVNR